MAVNVLINRKRKGKILQKNEDISGWKSHTNTNIQKPELYILAITDAFLDQKRVNICKHALVVSSLPCVHIYLLSSDWERHLWSPKYIIQDSVWMCVTYIPRFLNFLVIIFPSYPYFRTFLFTLSLKLFLTSVNCDLTEHYLCWHFEWFFHLVIVCVGWQ